MAYYRIRYSKKSHGDRPNPTVTDYIQCDPSELSDRIRLLTHDCEDWSVSMITRDTFLIETYEKSFINHANHIHSWH